MKKILITLFCLGVGWSWSQTGTLKGKVIDKQSEKPLESAQIALLNVQGFETTTDANGSFMLTGVPLGRQMLSVQALGYASVTLPNLEITAGKELILTIPLTEQLTTLNEVVVKNETSKGRALNKMATVSARQFTVEEVNRYAGGRSDVARLVANFAGVSAANDSRNDIVVRGNSPAGMLWRIEGVPVPSPNHFATLGTTGSPVSALNPNMLANSDFLTSAFPAEYGNAISGVFDLNFRKGNADRYEFMAGVGAYPGAEFVAEGPLGKKGGSFLVAARYGIAGYLGGAGTGAAIPNYNDVSFHLDFGKLASGSWSLFGIGGLSNINFLGKDATDDDLFSAKDSNQYVDSQFSVLGVSHKIYVGPQTFWKTTLAWATSGNRYEEERIYNFNTPNALNLPFTLNDNQDQRYTVSTFINSKVNKKTTLKAGILGEYFSLDYSLDDRNRQPDTNLDGYPDFNRIYLSKGNYQVIQPYAQLQYRFTNRLTLNAGIHGQYFSINEQSVVEPRAALTFAMNSRHSLNFGYGMHHQNVPAPILFQNSQVPGQPQQPNRHLDLVRSQHWVLGYDVKLAPQWRGKIELYYQAIDRAAVERSPSSYSSLTEGADFGYSTDKINLVSQGRGYNAGVEFTLEKFFSKGYHALITTSLFESKYRGSDGLWYNSPFNNRYVVNVLGGKEFKVGANQKNTLSFDGKVTTSGGRFYTPVDLVASQQAGYEITQDDKAYSLQYEAYFRLDLRVGYKFNSTKKKQSHLIYLEVQNVTDNNNIFISRYNRVTNQVNRVDQIGRFPDFGYRFQF